jgi:hypothetical protein
MPKEVNYASTIDINTMSSELLGRNVYTYKLTKLAPCIASQYTTMHSAAYINGGYRLSRPQSDALGKALKVNGLNWHQTRKSLSRSRSLIPI